MTALRLFPVLVAIAMTWVSVPGQVSAQTSAGPEDSRDQEARALFDAGESAYNNGRYQDALERFELAFEMSPRPELLFNIGSSAERLRRDEQALEAYRGYLQALPDAENRDAVEARIAILEEAHREATNQASPAEDHTGSSTPVLGWVLSGAALLFAGAAVTTWLIGDSEFSDLEAMCLPMGGCSQDVLDDSSVSTMDTLTNVALVLSIASAVGAGVSFVLSAGSADAAPPAAQVNLGMGHLSLSGRF